MIAVREFGLSHFLRENRCPPRIKRGDEARGPGGLGGEHRVRTRRETSCAPMAPNPWAETLLHAFLPHKFVDHPHPTAVLSLIDQPDGAALCAETYDGRMALVPYVMPGFALAKLAAEIYESAPAVEGLILHKHGIFTFGETAAEAYARMIEMVTRADERLARNRTAIFETARLPQAVAPPAVGAPVVRGACSAKDERSEGAWRRLILEFRATPAILTFVNGAEVARYSQAGVATPDHTIRTKNWPVLLRAPEDGRMDSFKRSAQKAVLGFIERYKDYFTRNNARVGSIKRMLDPLPRVALLPGLGLLGLGRTKKDAKIAADIAEAAITTITDAEAIGRFESTSEADMFDMASWSP